MCWHICSSLEQSHPTEWHEFRWCTRRRGRVVPKPAGSPHRQATHVSELCHQASRGCFKISPEEGGTTACRAGPPLHPANAAPVVQRPTPNLRPGPTPLLHCLKSSQKGWMLFTLWLLPCGRPHNTCHCQQSHQAGTCAPCSRIDSGPLPARRGAISEIMSCCRCRWHPCLTQRRIHPPPPSPLPCHLPPAGHDWRAQDVPATDDSSGDELMGQYAVPLTSQTVQRMKTQ